MNSPNTKYCTSAVWNLISSNINDICIWCADNIPNVYLYTYRIHGESASNDINFFYEWYEVYE